MRENNPLNPSYKLSQVEIRPVTPPKFIRDHLKNDDIEGSKPKKPTYYETRDTILVSVIIALNLILFSMLLISRDVNQEIGHLQELHILIT